MIDIYTVWANTRDSRNVKAFKSALLFREKQQEKWEWSADFKDSDLWILDADHNSESLMVYATLYDKLTDKPAVAVIGSNTHPNTALPAKWKVFSSPVSVPTIFQWLDSSINSGVSTASHTTTDKKPWREHYFKLIAWPNISQLGTSNVYFTITCSNLLNRYYNFDAAQQWGLSADLLDSLLSNAYNNSLLKIDNINSEEMSSNIELNQTNPSNHKNQSLIQKLLNRLK